MPTVDQTAIERLKSKARPKGVRRVTVGYSLPPELAAQVDQAAAAAAVTKTDVVKDALSEYFAAHADLESMAGRTTGKGTTVKAVLVPRVASALKRETSSTGVTVADIINQALARFFEIEVVK